MLISRKTSGMIVAIVIMALTVTAGCSKKRPVVSKGLKFSSVEELAKYVCLNANDGNSDAIIEAYMPKKDYLENVYPQTLEGKSKKHLSGEDFWRLFIDKQRISGATYQARHYKGRILSVVDVGPPKKVIPAGPYTLLHRVPVHLEVMAPGGTEQKIDDEIIGVVIAYDNTYRLFNVFR